MNNFDKIIYTMKHKHALELVANKYYGSKMMEQIKYHDMDKVLMMLFMDKELASTFHRLYANHHNDGNQKLQKQDLIEMILDWECARYTKPDKPLNAYDTLNKYYNNLNDEVMPILIELKLDYKSLPFDYNDEIYLKVKDYNISEKEINNRILDYVNNGNMYNDILKECAKLYLEKYD